MRIAWFTPFNPHSAIGHYSEVVVSELARTDEVALYVSDGARPAAPDGVRVVRLADGPTASLLRELEGFDAVVYNMGNHCQNHKRIYEVLLERPGVVVLHDLVLRDFFFGYALQDKRTPELLARMMAYGGGAEAQDMARAFLAGRHVEAADDPVRLRFPMFQPALHRCQGVVVHSEYSRARVAAAVAAPVEVIDFPPFGLAAGDAFAPLRPPKRDRLRLLTFGVLVSNKMVHAVVDCIAASDFLRGRVEYDVVGDGDDAYLRALRGAVARHGISEAVRLPGRLSDDRLRQLLAEADVVINLRNPHCGESSASLLDSLHFGAATVVWNHGYYAEFPDDAVCKISSLGELTPVLERLCGDAELRRRIGAEARRHALARFNTARFCRRLRSFLENVRFARPVLSLADRLSDRLLEFGPRPPDGLAERLAAEIALMSGGQSAAAA